MRLLWFLIRRLLPSTDPEQFAFVGTALAIAMGVSAAASIGTAAIGAHAAGSAADKQASAAERAAQIQAEQDQKALDFQKEQFATQQKNLAPWLATGTQAIGTLGDLMKTPGQGLLTPWSEQFKAPTGAEVQATPGYQFQLQEGQKALERAAAARGGLLSGGTAKALTRYGQDYADTKYGEAYNRAQGEYQQRYGIFENNQTNEYNRLAGVSGVGQQAATTLGQQGQAAANNVTNIYGNMGNAQASGINNAAAARASGYLSAADQWGGALSSIGNLGYLALLMKGQKPGPQTGIFDV